MSVERMLAERDKFDFHTLMDKLPDDEYDQRYSLVKEFINFILSDYDNFVANTKISRSNFREIFEDSVREKFSNARFDNVFFCFYCYSREIFLRQYRKSSDTVFRIIAYVKKNEYSFPEDQESLVDQFCQRLPVELAKEEYRNAISVHHVVEEHIQRKTKEIEEGLKRAIENTEGRASLVEGKIDGWEKFLNAKEDQLNNIQTKYNFVGLSKGFNDIEGKKRNSRGWVLFCLVAMGVVTITVPLIGLLVNFQFEPELKWTGSFMTSLQAAPLVLPIEILCIYYFRILLKIYTSMSAQILQLELRQSLCAFIQSYVEYKKEMGKEVSVNKFEDLIFSGITMEPDQIPQTFDGLEKLASALNALKSS